VAARESGTQVTRIGRFAAGSPCVSVIGPDGPMRLGRSGWDHLG